MKKRKIQKSRLKKKFLIKLKAKCKGGGGQKNIKILNMTISKVNLRNVVIAVIIIAKMETTFNLALSIFFFVRGSKPEMRNSKMRVEKREGELISNHQDKYF